MSIAEGTDPTSTNVSRYGRTVKPPGLRVLRSWLFVNSQQGSCTSSTIQWYSEGSGSSSHTDGHPASRFTAAGLSFVEPRRYHMDLEDNARERLGLPVYSNTAPATLQGCTDCFSDLDWNGTLPYQPVGALNTNAYSLKGSVSNLVIYSVVVTFCNWFPVQGPSATTECAG